MHQARILPLAISSLLLVATGATAIGGFPDNGTTVIATGGGDGSGWVTLEVTTDGATAYIDVVGNAIAQPGHAAAYRYTAQGRHAGGAQVVAFADLDGAAIHIDAGLGDEPVHYEADTVSATGGWGAAVRIRINDPGDGPAAPGTFRYLLMASGSRDWQWEVRGGAGVRVVFAHEGAGVTAHDGGIFTGPANAGGYVNGLGGRATLVGEHRITAQHTLVGTLFATDIAGFHMLDLDVDGRHHDCPCSFGSHPVADGPGLGSESLFQVTGAGGGRANYGDVFLAYADVPLPWPAVTS